MRLARPPPPAMSSYRHAFSPPPRSRRPHAAPRPSDLETEADLGRLCDAGLPDAELCDASKVTPMPAPTAAAEAWSRGRWLAGLLILQSAGRASGNC